MLMINHPEFGKYEVETFVVDDKNSFTVACSPMRYSLPSNGGIRWLHYDSLSKQKNEAVMLARSMDLKHKLYNTGFSGGKIVVNSSETPEQAPQVFDEIAKVLNRYNGTMYTGCDINTNSGHMKYLKKFTPWILDSLDNPNVNTSIATGYGVWSALQKIIEFLSTDTLPVIAIHGMGKVGCEIAHQCIVHGYDVVAFDINIKPEIPVGVKIVNEDDFWATPSHVLCISSLSGILDIKIVNKIKTKWIISSSNSPFQNLSAQKKLIDKKIKYLPDFVSNAGAVICDCIENRSPSFFNKLSQNQANYYVSILIGTKVEEILRRSDFLGCDPSVLINC